MKKTLSKVYRLLSHTNSIHLPISKWEEDLSLPSDIDFWIQICKNTFEMTKNLNLQLIQYKVLHRSHITQHKMYRMGFSDSNICTQCAQNTEDTYIHALWSCSPVQQFWSSVTLKMSSILGFRIPLTPTLCLLGDLSVLDLPKTESQPILVALAIAKKTILVHWKDKHTLNVNHWQNLLIEHISLERISATRKNKSKHFIDKWSTFLSSFNIYLQTDIAC